MLPDAGAAQADGARRPPGFDTATVTTRPSRIGEADAVLVTVAAPTKLNRRPARRHRRWRHTRSVVVTLDGA